jgi:hypothetical protein
MARRQSSALVALKKDMCDPVLIAAILTTLSPRGRSPVAIFSLPLEELGYFDKNEENGKKDEVRGKGSKEDNSKIAGKKIKNNSFIHA